MNKVFFLFISFILLLAQLPLSAQPPAGDGWWHNKPRSIHYRPEGQDFVCVEGKLRFNRALYGTNTAFRVEAGDLPEFALYLPGMGGNFKLGIIGGSKSKWLINAQKIKTIYRPGSMIYEISDPLLGNGLLRITVLALAEGEGMVLQASAKGIPAKTELCWAFGGATGKKFSRDGDIGADPESSFYLQPGYCKDNSYSIQNNTFRLYFGTGKVATEEERYEINQRPANNDNAIPAAKTKNNLKQLIGIVPPASTIKIVDAEKQGSPLELYKSATSATPAIAGRLPVTADTAYFLIGDTAAAGANDPARSFSLAEKARATLAGRVKLNTPDAYLNTLGGALGIAADGIWEDSSYLHGAVAWRMRLNAWRGPYVADPLGWHDRAEKHFSSYALSQVTSPLTGPVVADTALHLARQLEKLGTSVFSSGYISRNPGGDQRAHHYDMNLVFIDELLEHFNWTGNWDYVKKMWPLLQRHLAWEKRNFDADGDGLYDAYAAIWASDALQYSGGGVTHSSAYNYRANKMAAELAAHIGEDPTPYRQEADKILNAMNRQLWMPADGWYAEYKDKMGLQLLHPAAGLWSIYHAIDSKVPDPFQAWQCLQYINTAIPHIPVKAKGLSENDLYVLSTTNWQPYTWSLNNVVLAELQHTALAYWQANDPEQAYTIWKSSLVESMYLGASPGNFQQLSFYDAIRGELYRDFADPIGTTARSLVEGLFGIAPDALHDTLTIRPGLPLAWKYASLHIPDLSFDYKQTGLTDRYTIRPLFSKPMQLKLQLRARMDVLATVTVNGKKAAWQISPAIGAPDIILLLPPAPSYDISVTWKGARLEQPAVHAAYAREEPVRIHSGAALIMDLYDPQNALKGVARTPHEMIGIVQADTGHKTFFVQLRQGTFSWWQPVSFTAQPMVSNHPMETAAVQTAKAKYDKIDISAYYNDKVTNIFKQSYLSPRPAVPTLQLPVQGIGNWCYPLVEASIDDAGLRREAGATNTLLLPGGIPLGTPGNAEAKNILFTSQWDNYPDSATVPLSGRASAICLLMAGSTNPMQSQLDNGLVTITYSDGTVSELPLRNPANWWPIQEDYYTDGYAFTT
ncbi:MAG TPA: DUF4450 domain-containing protein, partial [Chitinophagaceae bacterium]|nr:DUF4450 domain-containing protein [Chitinophagaceae bacterium]